MSKKPKSTAMKRPPKVQEIFDEIGDTLASGVSLTMEDLTYETRRMLYMWKQVSGEDLPLPSHKELRG